jgi:RNA polymerase sigma factor (sigma-70 family)
MPTIPTAKPTLSIDPDHAAALLIAWRRGRPRAADELIRLCEPFVRRNASRYAWHRDDVEDIVQQVWMRLLLNASMIRDPKTLLAWLRIVTRRVAIQHGHRESRFVPSPMSEDQASPASTEDDAIDHCHRDRMTSSVRQALERLPDSDQQLLLLLHRDNRPGYEAIGRAVQRPVGSLGPSRKRLLERLRNDRRLAGLQDLPAAG